MEQFIQSLAPAIGQFGAPALLAVATLMFFMGKIIAKPTVDKLLQAKDERFDAMVLSKDETHKTTVQYYERQLSLSQASHEEIRTDLRKTAETASTALSISANNVQELLKQQDELLEIARTTAPALIAARTVVTGTHDRQEGS